MTAPDIQPPPPPLEWVTPICPVCGEHVAGDDTGYRCETCDASWPLEPDQPGEWNDPGTRCTSIDGRYLPGGYLARQYGVQLVERSCLLPAGHPPKHPWASHVHVEAGVAAHRCCWGADDEATVEQIATLTAAVTS